MKAIVLAAALTLSPSNVLARELVFIVEQPYSPTLPPSDGQLERAREVSQNIVGRAMQLYMEDYVIVNGLSAAQSGNGHVFRNADIIVQVMIEVTRLGYVVSGKLYDKEKMAWYELLSKAFQEMGPQPVSDRIANELFPRMLVHASEAAHPSQYRILLVDCLLSSDIQHQDLARRLTVRYNRSVSQRVELKQTYRVVPLIPTVQPEFFRWWCIQLSVPRYGSLRDDTTTVYGFVEAITGVQKPALAIEVRRKSGRVRTDEIEEIDESQGTLKRITDVVEGLANGM